MKQNNSPLSGTGKVFSFTLTQFFKNKGNIISLVIMLIMAMASVPLMALIGGGSSTSTETSDIQNVYYINETGFPVSADQIQEVLGENSYFADTVFAPADFTLEEYFDELSRDLPPAEYSMTDMDVCVVFSTQEATDELPAGYAVRLVTSMAPAFDEGDLENLQAAMTDVLDNARLSALSITDDQLAVLMSNWNVETQDLSEYLNPEDEDKWDTQYAVQLIYAIVVMMVSIFSVSYIVQAVVEEKASKLVELLMVSVKPLALIVGKILAALVYIILMFGIMIGGYIISYHVTGMFLDVSATGNLLAQMGVSTDLLRMGPFLILVVLFSLLLGFMTFAIISGLSATGCSSTEDTQSAMSGSTFLIMLGYIVSLVAGSADVPVLNHIISVVPVISLYSAPVNYIMGNIGLPILLLSWALQIVVIIVLALFCARVYTNLLMYRGSRVKFTQMITMAKQARVRKEEN